MRSSYWQLIDLQRTFALALIGALFAFLMIPEIAFAADSDVTATINEGFDFMKLFFKGLVYMLMLAALIGYMYLLVKSMLDWKDENKRDANGGSIVMVFFIGLGIMTIVFLVGEKALDYIDNKVTITASISPSEIIQVASQYAHSIPQLLG